MILEHAIKCYKAYRVIPPKNSLPTNLYKELCPKGSQPGLMHGLATIHKPLVNNFQTLDLYFQQLIPLPNGYDHIKDSFAFADGIMQFCLFVASLHIDSLFITISLAKTIYSCIEIILK